MKSIHGWDVIEDPNDSRLRLFQIPGCPDRKMRLRRDIGPYLVAFAGRYHQKIAPLNKGTYDDWAWAPLRNGRASSRVSDHCAGVAIDLNATKEGAQDRRNKITFWSKPITAMRLRVLRRRFKLLEWGGDYQNFYDPMHWTFKYGVTVDQIKSEMKRMKIKSNGKFAE